MTGTVVEIDRVPLTFIAATAPDRAERVSRRIRDAVARTLPAALESACGHSFDDDASVVFVDHLEVDLSVAAQWPDDVIGSALAERILQVLMAERERGEALVFRDRTEFVSAFLADTADRRAIGRWWFTEFDGLAALPASACIRTVVVGEGQLGWDALARLSPESLARVVSTLDGADVGRLLEAIAELQAGPAPPARAMITALADAMIVPLPTRSHQIVLAMARLVGLAGPVATRGTLSAMRALVHLVDAARRGEIAAVFDESPPLTLATWCEAVGIGEPERTALLRLESAEIVEHVASHAAQVVSGDAASSATSSSPFESTPWGGALVLCVVLVRSGWWVAWRDALESIGPASLADGRAASLALAVVARALDPRHPGAIERDATLRRVFGAGGQMARRRTHAETRASIEALAASEAAAGLPSGPAHLNGRLDAWARALLEEAGRRIPGCEGSTARYLRSQCLTLPAAVNADATTARLGRPPLDVLLRFSGLKRATITLPDGRDLSLIEDPDG